MVWERNDAVERIVGKGQPGDVAEDVDASVAKPAARLDQCEEQDVDADPPSIAA